jgi:hypothetical protein
LATIEYVSRESGLDPIRDFRNPTFALSALGDVALMERYVEYAFEQKITSILDQNMRTCVEMACHERRGDMVRFLLQVMRKEVNLDQLSAFIDAEAWDCAKLLISEVTSPREIARSLTGSIGRDLHIFERCMLSSAFIDPYLGIDLIRFLIYEEIDFDIIKAVINRTRDQQAEVYRLAYDHTVAVSYMDHSLVVHAGLLKWLIGKDPSLIQESRQPCLSDWVAAGGGLTIMGLCELCPTRLKNRWSGRACIEEPFHKRFFMKADEDKDGPVVQSSGLDREWEDTHFDAVDLKVIDDLKGFLISHKADFGRLFTRSCVSVAVEHWSDDPLKQSALEYMLAHGADINDGLSGKWSALAYCASKRFGHKCSVLMNCGASIFKENDSISFAMVAAANPIGSESKNNVSVLGLLFERAKLMPGFNINRLDMMTKYQISPLHSAVESQQLDNLGFLIEKGADVNVRSGFLALTPLMLALGGSRDRPVRELLINKGSDLNARNEHGRTAFYTYCLVGCFEGCEQLMLNGADISIPDNHGVYPIDIVRFMCEHTKRLRESGVRSLEICPYPVSHLDKSEIFEFHDQYKAIRFMLEKRVRRERFYSNMSALDFATKYRIDSVVHLLS